MDWPDVERKTLTVVFHYRTATDEGAARTTLEDVARRARAAGLRASFGRKVLEVLPPLEANKGRRCAGCSTTPACTERSSRATTRPTSTPSTRVDGLELAVRVAVVSDESPAALREAADVVVSSTGEFLELLRCM